MKKYLFCCCLLLASCASTHSQGWNYYEKGDYQTALDYFNSCASSGTGACYNAIGVMYERRKIKTVTPIKDAARYYTIAARYDVGAAKSNLIRLGYVLKSRWPKHFFSMAFLAITKEE
ncbi:MAG: hypothetical protein ABGX72_03665 [Methyloprofundus sp.]